MGSMRTGSYYPDGPNLLTGSEVWFAVFFWASAGVSNSGCSAEYCFCSEDGAGWSDFDGVTESGSLYGALGLPTLAYHRDWATEEAERRTVEGRTLALARGRTARLSIMEGRKGCLYYKIKRTEASHTCPGRRARIFF